MEGAKGLATPKKVSYDCYPKIEKGEVIKGYRIFSKNSSHLVSQKIRLTRELLDSLTLRTADETLESATNT